MQPYHIIIDNSFWEFNLQTIISSLLIIVSLYIAYRANKTAQESVEKTIKANRDQMREDNNIKTNHLWNESVRDSLSEYTSKLLLSINTVTDESFDIKLAEEFLKYNTRLMLLFNSDRNKEQKVFYELLEFNDELFRYNIIHRTRLNNVSAILQDNAKDLQLVAKHIFINEWKNISDFQNGVTIPKRIVEQDKDLKEIEDNMKIRKLMFEKAKENYSSNNF